jgi:hypothetical protein
MQSLNNESNPKQAQTRSWGSKHVFFYQTILRNTSHVVVSGSNGQEQKVFSQKKEN